jgi:catechol 2,3-dioxygenase-like lactoylglutathione lyase family enzyme
MAKNSPCVGAQGFIKCGMNFSVEHIGLPSVNPVALRDWYVAKLSATCLAPNGSEPPFFIRPPGSVAMFEIYAATATSLRVDDNGLAGWRHLALRVDSIESAQKELEARGVQFNDPIKPAAGGGRVLFFKDHEGNLLHLVDRPADTKII